MHLHCYFITLAENEEDAKSSVEIYIDDYANREFFDYGGLDEPEECVLLDEIRADLEKEKAEVFEKMLPDIEKKIAVCKAENNKDMEGYWHIQYGRILSEYPCYDMPFLNISNGDWSLPTEVPEDCKNCNWYAVKVDLHC